VGGERVGREERERERERGGYRERDGGGGGYEGIRRGDKVKGRWVGERGKRGGRGGRGR
jgi:hypothetical protein